MGISSSCESKTTSTAKLILDDGRLKEYSYPVKVSYVLEENPACFICNSDEMDFDDVVSDMIDDEELQPGQIYFAFPLNRLKRRLQAEEMAALAVKASSALTKSGCCGEKCGGYYWNILVFPDENGMNPLRNVAGGGQSRLRRGRSSGGGCGRRGKFTAKLIAIRE